MNGIDFPIAPSPIRVNTGDEADVRSKAEEFFSSILSFLGYGERETECFTTREDRVLTDFTPASPIQTSNEITLLIVKDVPVASVLYWRDQYNYVRVAYAHYLTKEVIERLRWQERS